MSTKSQKNILTIILFSSVAIFVAAVIWKNNQPTHEEVVNVTKKQPVKKKPKKKKDLSFLESEFVQNNPEDHKIPRASDEHRKKLTSKMNMAIMYKTPEQVMETLVYYQEKGQDDKVDELLAFLLERFPDYEVPEDF